MLFRSRPDHDAAGGLERAAAARACQARQENGYGKVTTSGHHDQRLFAAPIGQALWVISPVAARNRAQAGVGCQGGFAPPCAAALPLTACPGCAFSPASGGGISSRTAPFSKIGKGRGEKVDPPHYIKTEVFKMKRPLAYITAAWSGDPCEATEQAAKYCRAVYEAGFSQGVVSL